MLKENQIMIFSPDIFEILVRCSEYDHQTDRGSCSPKCHLTFKRGGPIFKHLQYIVLVGTCM
jgi:hypothetical protein